MKFFRYFFYFIIFIFLLISPIYAFSRIFLPDWVVSTITANLPTGSKLKIGSITSNADLGFIYNDIIFQAPGQSFVIKISSLNVEPRLSFNAPLELTAENFILYDKNTILTLNNLKSNIVIEDFFQKEVSFSGNLDSLSSSQKAAFYDINFILKGLNSQKKLLSIESESSEFNITTPFGPIVFKTDSSLYDIALSDKLEVDIKAKKTSFDMTKMKNGNEGRILFVEETYGKFTLKKEENWTMPLELNLIKPRAFYGPISSRAILKSKALWPKISKDCSINNILLFDEICGKITDVVNLNISLENENGELNFQGDGYCVTPKSECLQEIKAVLSSKNTADVLSKIISSGIINPLFGSVILGSLISSPALNSNEHDHQIDLEVKGSSIKINGKPLI